MLDTLLHALRAPSRSTPPRPSPAPRGEDLLVLTASQLHQHRVNVLRDWLGEDHDFVRTLPPAAGAGARATASC